MSIPVEHQGSDSAVAALTSLVVASEHRAQRLERLSRRLLLAVSILVPLVLFLGLRAVPPALAQARAVADVQDDPSRAGRRAELLASLPEMTRNEIEQFERQARWLSEYLRTFGQDFDAGAVVALFLSKMAEDMHAMPNMNREMQTMNANMAAVPAIAVEMQRMNQLMTTIAANMDSTMGRMGRSMPWMPWSP